MDIEKYFPYKYIRPQQKQVVETIYKNWNTKKYFILQLDVGTGKSGIAKCMCNYVPRSFIITSTKQLQAQYLSDFYFEKNIEEIKGKNNYICKRNPNTTCDLAVCKIGGRACPLSRECEYTLQRNKAINSKVTITSYAYALKGIKNNVELWPKRDLIVFDEAHLLESELVNSAQFEIDAKYLDEKFNLFDDLSEENFKRIMKVIKDNSDYKFILDTTSKCLDSAIKNFDFILEDADPNNTTNFQEVLKNKEYLSNLNTRISSFLKTYKTDLDWMISPTIEGTLQFTPLKVKNLFKYFCSDWANKFIFMSATILDIDGYIKQLGVDKEDCCVIKMESEFDPKKSPIYFMPCGSMSYSEMNNTLPKEAKIIQQITEAHRTEKGIIHTGNYKVAEYMYKFSNKNSRLIYNKDGKTNNQLLLKRHIRSTQPTILLSPSMTTGVDLKDDLSRWQVVCKLPYKSLADERIKKLSQIDPNWYACDVLRSLIQACGRSTRSEDDSSKTYILDSGFSRLIKQHKQWLPQSFLKRIIGLEI